MRIAAIEIGTNSTKFAIMEHDGSKRRIIERLSSVSRLSRNMYPDLHLEDEAMADNLQIISGYIAQCRNQGAELAAIFSTSVLRDASNGQEFIDKVTELSGVKIEVISGEREAYLSHKACVELIDDDKQEIAVIDIGGGSTEIITGTKSIIDDTYSIDIGAVRLTEMFIKHDPPNRDEVDQLCYFINERLNINGDLNLQGRRLIGTGGTLKSLGTIYCQTDYGAVDKIHGVKIKLSSLESIYSQLMKLTIAARKKIPGLNPKRADVIIAGITILLYIMNRFTFAEIMLSSHGVLEGFLADYQYY